MKAIRLILQFYGTFVFLSLLITMGCVMVVYLTNGFFLKGALLAKLMGNGAVILAIESNQKTQFVYYRNLGLTKMQLWVSSLVFDFVIFISLVLIVGHVNG